MYRGSENSRLHRLINDSVRGYTEPEIVSLAKEQEQELLSSLSQILKQVQLWTREFDHDSDYELEMHSEDHLYLYKIIADMGSKWDLDICFLVLFMEMAVTNVLSSSSTTLKAEFGNSHFDSSSFVGVIKPRLKYARWSSLAGILLVLCNILICLKQDYDHDDHLAEVHMHSAHFCLSNVPWDSWM